MYFYKIRKKIVFFIFIFPTYYYQTTTTNTNNFYFYFFVTFAFFSRIFSNLYIINLFSFHVHTNNRSEIPYFAEGSAHSSQFLQPDGSLITNSKGSSITSDGIQQTFHELKKEADKFISKR